MNLSSKLIPLCHAIPVFTLGGLAMAFAGGCSVSIDDGGNGGSVVSEPVPTSCGEEAACPRSQECLATVSNHGAAQFALRISELAFSSPSSFAQNGAAAFLINALFAPSLPACANLAGGGDTSWLLRFDLSGSTLTVGGAAPVANASDPYALVSSVVQQGAGPLAIAPATFPLAHVPGGAFSTSGAEDVVLPMYFPADKGVEGPHALPLHQLALSNMVVSATHDCIGRYDPAVFDPAQDCSSGTGMVYQHAGDIDGFLVLEEMDALPISTLSETMCALITRDMSSSSGASGIFGCARTSGKIDFRGDWCAETNGPATPTCFDAVRVHATFAASAARVE